MDRHDGFKVLAQYRDMPRPDGPFALGDAGDVMGVHQTVVGIVGVQSRIEGEMYYWTNYQLYAPTHGYSWMTWNDGHLTHSRKVRDGTDHTQASFFPKGDFPAMGRNFKMFDEIETELQTYLNRKDVMESFGFDDDLPSPNGVHAIQPFEPGALHMSAASAAKVFLPFAAVGALGLMLLGGGSTVAQTRIANTAAGGALTFEAPSTTRLMSIEMSAPLRNQWAWYDMTLVHDESGEEVEFGSGLQYYSGRSGGESWSEGSQEKYTLRIANAPLDKNVSRSDRQQFASSAPLSIEVRQNVFVSRYFWILAIVLGLIFGSLKMREWLFEGARWGGGGDDDD